MAEYVYSLRDAEAQIFDETPDTPLFLRIHFLEGTLAYKARRPRSTEELMINQEKMDTLAHYRIVSDRPTFEPQDISIECLMHSDRTINDTLVGMSNPFDAATWQPGGIDTFVGASTPGSTDNAEGVSVAHPLPRDAQRAASLTRLEFKLVATTTSVMQFDLVFWEDIDFNIGDPATFKGAGKIFGAFTHASAFSTGTEIT